MVGLLPLGTGNDFARGNDIPLDIEEAARVLLEGTPKPVDLLVDELGGIVVNNVHVGAGAVASKRAHRWKKRLRPVGLGKVNLGKLGYPIGAAITAYNPPVVRLRVEVDHEVVVDFDEPVLMVAVGNGASRRRRHRAHAARRHRGRPDGRDDLPRHRTDLAADLRRPARARLPPRATRRSTTCGRRRCR